MEELNQAKQDVEKYKSKIPPKDTLRNFLRLSRETRVKNAEEVAKYGCLLLKHYRRRLVEEELWLVHEQVAIAAFECNAVDIGVELVKKVLGRFPDSKRALRLQGMYYEACGKLERAEKFYTEVLAEDPANELMVKRMVALHKTKGDLESAIRTLRTYLDSYVNDQDGWQELADLYLETGMYRQAAFCFEELITLSPAQPLHHIQYADTLYTLGGPQNCRTARAYYSKALQLSGGHSVRALTGLLAASAQISDKDTSSTGSQLTKAAADTLLTLYKQEASDKLGLIEGMLTMQGNA